MLLPQDYPRGSGCGARRHNVANARKATCACGATALMLLRLVVGLVALAAWVCPLRAGTVYLPNASFESPVVPTVSPYAIPDMDYWEKSPQPAWYYPANNYNTPWEDLMGTFYNFPDPSTFIDNCDGTQAAFLFACPDVAIFQDYDSIYGTNTTPSHAFNATFNVGSAYSLTVGVIGGVYGTPPLYEGATLQLSLYYRDACQQHGRPSQPPPSLTARSCSPPIRTSWTSRSSFPGSCRPTRGPTRTSACRSPLPSGPTSPADTGIWITCAWSRRPCPHLPNPQVTNNQFSFTVRSQPGLQIRDPGEYQPRLPL